MRKKRLSWIGFVFIINLVWPGLTTISAQTQEKIITMDEAVSMALKNNFSVAIGDLTLETKRRQRDLAWNYFLPTIETSATLSHANDDPGPLAPRSTLSTSLNMLLPLSVKMVYGIRQTILDYDAGKLAFDTAKRKLELDVRKNFLNLLVLEENIKLLQKNIEATKSRFELARINYRNGLVDEYTMLAAQVDLEALKPNLMDTENAYTSVLLFFKTLIGADMADPIKLTGSIEPEILKLNTEKLITLSLANSPDIRSLKANLKMIENAKGVAMSDFFPYLAVFLRMDPALQKDAIENPWFEDLERDWRQRTGSVGFTITVPLHNLIPGSKTWQEIKNTQNKIERTNLEMEQLLVKTEMDIRLAVLKLKKSEEAIRTYQLSVNLAEKANGMGQQAFKAGLKDYSEIQNTELKLNRAQVDLLREKFNYATGLLDLNYTINTNLEKVKE